MAAPPPPRIFVSYARSDGADLARQIQRRLEQDHGLPVWRDLAGLEGTDAWWPQVRETIDQIEYLVLIMTEAALRSEHVRREWRYARRVGTCVIPIQAKRDQSFDGLPRWMERHNFVPWRDEDSWRRLVRTLESPCRKTRVPFMVGDVPGDYVARPNEFDDLRAQLIDAERGQPVAITTALRGAGGFGKTTLARALCHDEAVRDAFADGILWVTLGQSPSEADRVEHIRDLIETLTDKRPGFANLEAAVSGLAGVLADREALIVVDDVWNAAHASPFLQGGPHCARLITTRNSDMLPANARHIDVDAMSGNEATALLRYGLPNGEDAAFDALAARLGEWPLLLKLANGVLRRRVGELNQSLPDALTWVSRALHRLGPTAFDAGKAEDRSQAVEETISVSLKMLDQDEHEDQEKDENKRARFFELAIFPEDVDVPLGTVAALWNRTAGLDEFETEALCEEFFGLSLVLDVDLATRRIRLHDVIRGYLQGKQVKRLPMLHAELVEAYGAKCPNGWHGGPNDGYYFQWLPYHLCQAKRAEDLRKLLFDYRWLRAKLPVAGVSALIEDLERFGDHQEARRVAGALRLSAHVIADDPRQLAGQLCGRLSPEDVPDAADLLRAAGALADRPAFSPVRRSLTPPGGPLLATLKGHGAEVNAVALTRDGRRAVSGSYDETVKVWDLEQGALLATLDGHDGPVTAVAVTADGRRAVSGSVDHTLKV